MSDIAKKVVSFIGLFGSPILTIILRKVFEVWGIFDPFSEWLGGWLKMHVSPAQVEWSIAGVIALGAYAALLWFVWRYNRVTPATYAAREIVAPAQDIEQSRLEIVLKSIHVGFDEMETRGWITIDISMHNSSGTILRIGNITGHIEIRPIVSLPQWLDSPTFSAPSTNISPWSDFHIILRQKFPEEARTAAMAAWNLGRVIQLNFSELRISVSGNNNVNVPLPLWYGATIEKKGGKYFTAELGALQ